MLRAAYGNAIAAAQADSLAAVHGKKGVFAAGAGKLHRDLAVCRRNDGTCLHIVGADRREHNILCSRLDQRAASRHGIGRGTGRRADDQSVAAEGHHIHAVALHGHLHHAGDRALRDDGVVQRVLLQNDASLVLRADVEHHARLDGEIVVRKAAQLLELAALQLRHEAHGADVHAEDRDSGLCCSLGGMEDRAVAAEADE